MNKDELLEHVLEENEQLKQFLASIFCHYIMDKSEKEHVSVPHLLCALATNNDRVITDSIPQEMWSQREKTLARELGQVANYYSGASVFDVAQHMINWKTKRDIEH